MSIDRPLRAPAEARALKQLGSKAAGLDHRWRVPGEIIYVGTVGVDDTGASYVDDFGDTQSGLPFSALSPAFGGAWTNGDPILEPVCFWLSADGHLHIAGLPTSGVLTDSVFTLPVGFRPFQQQPIVLPTDSPGVIANGVIGTDGQVWIIG